MDELKLPGEVSWSKNAAGSPEVGNFCATTPLSAPNMTTFFVAHRLVTLCREGLFLDAQMELMTDDCVQLEPATSNAENASGREAIQAKEWRLQTNILERHSIIISEPTIVGAFFCVTMHFDLTLRDRGRVQLAELIVYEVREGKIVCEQFFY